MACAALRICGLCCTAKCRKACILSTTRVEGRSHSVDSERHCDPYSGIATCASIYPWRCTFCGNHLNGSFHKAYCHRASSRKHLEIRRTATAPSSSRRSPTMSSLQSDV
ncbi:hypothetical protein BV20DRAFT_63539 [Pilatotrama ljubarskyi]|nr:hypothetical protein BV20DRAFT_63539 [Pilatotrama ljubarskyi]